MDVVLYAACQIQQATEGIPPPSLNGRGKQMIGIHVLNGLVSAGRLSTSISNDTPVELEVALNQPLALVELNHATYLTPAGLVVTSLASPSFPVVCAAAEAQGGWETEQVSELHLDPGTIAIAMAYSERSD